MTNVIAFLESLGGNGQVAGADYPEAVRALDIDADLRDALLRRDRDALGRLLGARHNVLFALVPAEDDEPAKDDDEIRAVRAG